MRVGSTAAASYEAGGWPSFLKGGDGYTYYDYFSSVRVNRNNKGEIERKKLPPLRESDDSKG